MKTIKHILYFASALSLFLIGCSEDFLETPPRGKATEESFYTNMEAAEAAVIAAYAELVIPQAMDIPFFMGMGCIASDNAEAGGKSTTDWEELQAFDRLTHTGAEASVELPWGYIYKGIYFCNFALEKLPIIKKDVDTEEQAIIDIRIGEVQFLRGLYYFLLTRAYGGVPKVTEPLAVSEFEMPRSTVKEIYELIEEDLLDAINVLPEKDQLDAVGRASKGAAKALLAKTYLYESSYAKNYPGDAPLWQCAGTLGRCPAVCGRSNGLRKIRVGGFKR
ncbi:MAG: RagB/SusD family nutrient uptake outer membrane protein [Bacteroidales bacterium]|nr:RagB/SusD family nutrient uptake outer membrane protein [Bacteroidales bacterium]